MAQPTKHPKTGVYYFRRAVPPAIRQLIGKSEWKTSLGTKDLAEAKSRHLAEATRCQTAFEQAARGKTPGTTTLTAQDIAALGGEWLDRKLKAQGDETGERLEWEIRIDMLEEVQHSNRRIEKYVLDDLKALISQEGLNIAPVSESWGRLSREIFRRYLDFYGVMIHRSDGASGEERAIKRELDALANKPEWKRPLDPTKTVQWALDRWIAERKPAQKTGYEWTRILKQFGLKRSLQAVSPADVVEFKDRWVAQQLKPNTIDKKLSALRTVFRWALDNKHIENDPTVGIKVAGLKAQKNKKKGRRIGYTLDEAGMLLRAARGAKTTHRWLIWVLAATGCRIHEPAQAFASDVKREKGTWFLDVTDKGNGQSLKTANSRRMIPIHPKLIEEGFLDYVESLPSGSRLFTDIQPDKFGNWGNNVDKTLNRWMKKVVPGKTAHYWRHSFKTAARTASTPEDVSDYLTGHAGGSEGREYGHNDLPALAKAIARIDFGAPQPLIVGSQGG